ncbi:MAG: hypothetical protein ACR2II_07845 [Chthoniobacterales bacterium]
MRERAFCRGGICRSAARREALPRFLLQRSDREAMTPMSTTSAPPMWRSLKRRSGHQTARVYLRSGGHDWFVYATPTGTAEKIFLALSPAIQKHLRQFRTDDHPTMKALLCSLATTISLASGSLAWADAKTQVITGRVVELDDVAIVVQSGKKRLEINSQDTKYAGVPKVGDTVTVYYTGWHHVAIADPEYVASKIEVTAKAVGVTKPLEKTVQVPGENVVIGTVVHVRNGYIDIPSFGQIRIHAEDHLYQPKVGDKVKVRYHLCGKVDVCADKIEKLDK